jgi:MYND finger
MSVRFCSTECQVQHWNNGHKYKCKQLAQERNIFVLVTPDILLHRYSYSDNGNNTGGGGSFRKPSGIDYGEPFIVKIQHLQEGGDDILWIYNKERDCEFFLYYDNSASTNHFTTSTGSKNTKQMEANNEHTKDCSDLIDILQSVQPNQQHRTVLSSKNNQNASMYITAIFENEHRCKLFIHQTKIKLW